MEPTHFPPDDGEGETGRGGARIAAASAVLLEGRAHGSLLRAGIIPGSQTPAGWAARMDAETMRQGRLSRWQVVTDTHGRPVAR